MWLHLTSTWFFPRFVRKKKGRKLSDFRKGRETLQVSSLWLGLRGLVAASSAPQRHALPPLRPPHVSRRPADSEAGGPLAAPDRQGSGTPSLSICQSLSSKTSHDTQTSARLCCALMPFKWPVPLPESDNSQAKSRFILCVCVHKQDNLRAAQVWRIFLERMTSSDTGLQSQKLWQLKILI